MSDSEFITSEESLLLIVDIQERLVPVMAQPEKLVGNVKRLLGLAEVLGLPVVVTEQEKLGVTIKDLGEKIAASRPIPKIAFNCFLADGFSARIEETGRNTLIIAGIEAHICVTQTALSAHPRFRVHVVGDAVASRSPDNVAFALDRMRSAGITVTSTEMAIYELLRKAGTPEFKAMLPLVK